MFAQKTDRGGLRVQPMDPSDHAAASTIMLLRALRVPISDLRVRERFREHPQRASTLAIVEVLTILGLRARGLRVDRDHLQRLPLPCIAHLESEGATTFAVVHEIAADSILAGDPVRGIERMSYPEFLARTTGIFVVADPPEKPAAGSRGRFVVEQVLGTALDSSRRSASWLFLSALLVLGLARVLFQDTGGWHAVLLVLTWGAVFVGLGLSEISLSGGAGARGPGAFLNHVCRSSAMSSCSSILVSPDASWLGRVPYAFLGLGFSCAVFASAWTPGPGWITLALLACSIPVAAWFTVLQAWKLRRWCIACMAYHALNFLATAATVAAMLDSSGGADAVPWHVVLIIPAGLCPVWMYQRRADRKQFDSLHQEWARLTQDPGVLLAVYQAAKPIPLEDDAAESEAPRIVLFSNPLCPHCPQAHRTVQQAAAEGGVRIEYRLVGEPLAIPWKEVLSVNRSVQSSELIVMLRALEQARGASAFLTALDAIFARQASFRRSTPREALESLGANSHEIEPFVQKGYDELHRDAAIANRARVHHTPSFFLNGRPVPSWATSSQVSMLIQYVRKTAPAGTP